MTQGHRIVAEGQHPDDTWAKHPLPGWESVPIRFSVAGKQLEPGDPVELLVQGVWLPTTFHGFANNSSYVRLSVELGYHEEHIERVTVPIDTRFRIPMLIGTT